ncbi:choline-binding protein, partial [Lactobacillus delbrueckii subsp. bulgaricus]
MTIGEKYIPTQDKVVWYSDDGTMLYGWQNIDGKVHYFDKITGKMTTGQ